MLPVQALPGMRGSFPPHGGGNSEEQCISDLAGGGGQVYVRHRSETKTQSFGQDGDTPFFWTLEGLNFPLLARMLSDIS